MVMAGTESGVEASETASVAQDSPGYRDDGFVWIILGRDRRSERRASTLLETKEV
jgi:hypothetical protein